MCCPHSLGRTPVPSDHGQHTFSIQGPGATQDQGEAQRPTHENVERQTQGKLEAWVDLLGTTHSSPESHMLLRGQRAFLQRGISFRNQGSTHIPAPLFPGASPADLHIGGIPSVSAHGILGASACIPPEMGTSPSVPR